MTEAKEFQYGCMLEGTFVFLKSITGYQNRMMLSWPDLRYDSAVLGLSRSVTCICEGIFLFEAT